MGWFVGGDYWPTGSTLWDNSFLNNRHSGSVQFSVQFRFQFRLRFGFNNGFFRTVESLSLPEQAMGRGHGGGSHQGGGHSEETLSLLNCSSIVKREHYAPWLGNCYRAGDPCTAQHRIKNLLRLLDTFWRRAEL